MNEAEKPRSRTTITTVLLIGVLVIIGVVGSIWLHKANMTKSTPYKSLSMKQAIALPKDGACATNNATVKKQVESQRGLGENDGLWTSQIYDVPAGTNVEVNITTYSRNDTITGSLIYPEQYGSYNFTVTKQSDEWRYTKFTGCE